MAKLNGDNPDFVFEYKDQQLLLKDRECSLLNLLMK